MKKQIQYLLCAILALVLASCGSSDSTSVDAAGKHNEDLLETTGKSEKAGWFVAEMSGSNLYEAEMGRLASSKGADLRVMEYGQLMLNHHTQLNTTIRQIADLKNLITPTSLDDKHQKAFTNIMEKAGPDFDKAYLEQSIDNHQEMVKRYQEMADEGDDAELKNFAAQSLSTLQAHLNQAKALLDEMD